MTKDEAANAVAGGALWGLGATLVGVLIGGWVERRKARQDEERMLAQLLERLDAEGYRLVKEEDLR